MSDIPARPKPDVTPIEPYQWQRGYTGNALGKMSATKRQRLKFREELRSMTECLARLMAMKALDPDVKLDELTRAFKEIADRAGYLPADRLAQAQATWAEAARRASEGQTPEFQAAVVAELQAVSEAALGPVVAKAEPEGSDDADGDD